MAALEEHRLVVRVVYAGAPMAGKTASVRALMPLLKGPGAERLVMSPAEDRGRTAFFDWADYDGGAFQGRPIHCQIASAPGQIALSDRRELVLRGADAVILVVDSRLEAIDRTLQCYEEMAPWLEEAGRDAPIRVLLQCNKQDLEGSLTPAELSRAIGLPFGKDVYATSARTTKGLRAAFVAGVRAAVERARVLLERGLILSAPEIASGEELLERMQLEESLRQAPSEQPRTPRRARSETSAPAPSAQAPSAPPEPPADSPSESRARVARRSPAGTKPHRAGAPAASARQPTPRGRSRRTEVESPPREPPPEARAPDVSSGAPRSVPAPKPPAPTVAASAPKVALRPPVAESPAEKLPSSAPRAVEAHDSERKSSGRAWTPGSGPRPAVMPASAFHALVGPPVSRAELTAWGIPTPLPSVPPGLPGTPVPVPRPSRVGADPVPSVTPRPLDPFGVRPAVMPASAYLAMLRAAGIEPANNVAVERKGRETQPSPAAGAQSHEALQHGSPRPAYPRPDPRPAAAPPSLVPGSTSPRPAVMPATAWRAWVAAGRAAEPVRGVSAAPGSGVPGGVAPISAAWEAPGEPARGEPPTVQSASSERPGTDGSGLGAAASFGAEHAPDSRPAVIPMSAWRRGGWAAASKPRSTPPGLVQLRTARPAVMPADAWRAMGLDSLALARRVQAQSDGAAVASAALDLLPPTGSSSVPDEPAQSLSASDASSAPVPQLPGQIVPRSTWPRATWRELAPVIGVRGRPRRDSYGRFIGEIAPGWFARSLDVTLDLKSARRSMARAVLRLRTLHAYLSGPRCLALTEEDGRFWVWQIVYRVPTLAGTLGKLLDGAGEPSAVADGLVEVASGYLEARAKFAAAPEPLPLSLQGLSAQEGRFVYAGLLPRSDVPFPIPSGDGEALEEALEKRWPGSLSPAIDAMAVAAELQRKAVGKLPEPIVEIIRGVLIRH